MTTTPAAATAATSETQATLTTEEIRTLRITVANLRRFTDEHVVQMRRETAVRAVERRVEKQRARLAELEAEAAAAGITDL